MGKFYYSFNDYLKKRFGVRVHRLSLNAGFACPNRDGTLSREGCIFCNQEGFANFPKSNISLEEQITDSISFFKKRFKAEKFIAYFQNSTNTYASLDKLKKAYDTIKKFDDIVGLSISTRPDCIDEERLNLIKSYSDKYDVWLEYGLQSVHDKTLKDINRGHTFAQFRKAVEATAPKNIKTSCHVILGLSGEVGSDMMETARAISNLPLSGVKIHILHVLKNTKLEDFYRQGKIKLLEEEEYVGLVCDFLEHLNPDFVIMRLVSNAREDILVAPKWINNKQDILKKIDREFEKRGSRQGIKYAK